MKDDNSNKEEIAEHNEWANKIEESGEHYDEEDQSDHPQ
jgi:hypothetical protein